MKRFIDLFKPYLIKESFENTLSCNFDKETIEQNLYQSSIYHHLNLLPKNLIQTIIKMVLHTGTRILFVNTKSIFFKNFYAPNSKWLGSLGVFYKGTSVVWSRIIARCKRF